MTIWRWGVLVVAISVGVARAQTDVAASVYGAFSGTTNGNGTTQSPSNAAGVLVEVRHISNPLVGYEGTYAYNRTDQNYSHVAVCPGSGNPPLCNVVGPVNQYVPANANEVTGDWIVSLRLFRVRPFVLAGGGLLLNQPSGSQSGTQSQMKGVLVYGGGLDYAVVPHLGVRLQYRGNLYKAADLATAYSSTGAFVHTAEPMLGAYLRF